MELERIAKQADNWIPFILADVRYWVHNFAGLAICAIFADL